MALSTGSRLGPYQIVAALGAGGMGEVYKARDTRLDRTVALKILPVTLAGDSQFRERFDREARAISQLAHPHICTLYDVGNQDGISFLVMEMLEGETLAERLDKPSTAKLRLPALPLEEALRIGIAIASALDAAHRSGIVHRDLKPGNVMLTKAGAKLVDFGLAKTAAPAVTTSGLSMAPTTPPASITAAGTILGTFQYMAPEQIEGLEADARTDIFAFGCVLYEMLTGRKAFAGKTRASLLGSILKDEPPPVSQFQPRAPAVLDRIVATCLAKEPDDRWQSARDVMRELQWAAEAGPAPTANTAIDAARSRSAALIAIATAVGVTAIVGAAVWIMTRQPAASRAVVRLQATPPSTAPLFIDGVASDLTISADGKRIAYVAGTGQSTLYVRGLDQLEATPIAGATNMRGPFFSPDGEWVAYFLGADLKKVSIHGGPPVTICAQCATGNRGGTWGPDDTIVFSANGGRQGLRRVAAAGGVPSAFTTTVAQDADQTWPDFLPNGEALLLTVGAGAGGEHSSIAVYDPKTAAVRILIRGGSQPHYLAPGRIVYATGGTLQAVAFDLSRLALVGNPVPVVEHVVMKSSGAADFNVSHDGVLAYISGDVHSVVRRLAWIDRQGHEEAVGAPPRNYTYLRLSPDGTRAALDVRDEQNDIWVWEFSRRTLTRLTTDPAVDQSPVWTPDGRRIVFSSSRGGALNLYWQAADGSGAAERLTTSPHVQVPSSFTPDGKSLVLLDTDPQTGADVSIMSLEGDRTVRPLVHTAFSESHAEVSPDGQWIAYESDESGRSEIHVRPFPAVDGGHWQVSNGGGSQPLWSPGGRELLWIDSQGRVIAAPVQVRGAFAFSNPSPTGSTGGAAFGPLGRSWDVSSDGRRFLIATNSTTADERTSPLRLNVVINWNEELKQRVPTR